MKLALDAAERAAQLGEVPVGALLVDAQGVVLATAHNRRQTDRDPTAHAEILVLREAARRLGDWRLVGTCLYVTLEPCPMCAGALVNARVDRLVFGCADPKAGAVQTLYALCSDSRLNHRVEVVAGVLAQTCAQRLSDFFAALRARKGS
ncbi:MAG: nucleoside deaminase [Proteobacteria bacterium]|nr:nucleoside deaminase [Pseudomonadota bacterium]